MAIGSSGAEGKVTIEKQSLSAAAHCEEEDTLFLFTYSNCAPDMLLSDFCLFFTSLTCNRNVQGHSVMVCVIFEHLNIQY